MIPLQQQADRNLHGFQFVGDQASRLKMPGSMPEHHRTALALLRAAYDDSVAINHLVALRERQWVKPACSCMTSPV